MWRSRSGCNASLSHRGAAKSLNEMEADKSITRQRSAAGGAGVACRSSIPGCRRGGQGLRPAHV